MLSTAHGASGFADLLTQLLQVAGEGGFSGIGEAAAAQPIRAALHAGAEIVFVHAIERRRPAASCCCMPPSSSVASRKRSAARRESAALAFRETARLMSSLAWRKRSSACWAACWRLSAAWSADCWELAPLALAWPADWLPLRPEGEPPACPPRWPA